MQGRNHHEHFKQSLLGQKMSSGLEHQMDFPTKWNQAKKTTESDPDELLHFYGVEKVGIVHSIENDVSSYYINEVIMIFVRQGVGLSRGKTWCLLIR